MMWSYPGHMGLAGWIGMVLLVLFWLAVIVAIVFLVRHLTGPRREERSTGWAATAPPGQEPRATGHRALQILEERYARGEIDQAEFFARRADLDPRA